jgi:hypothetical protein
LLAQGAVNEEGLDLCSKEFARSLRPHVAELREVMTVCLVSSARGRVSMHPLLRTCHPAGLCSESRTQHL